MFDFDVFYLGIKSIDLKTIDLTTFESLPIDFLGIDKKISSSLHKLYSPTTKDFSVAYNRLYECYKYYFDNYPTEMLIARKLNINLYHRTVRLKKRVQFMLDNFDCLFLTFTFTNHYLNSTSAVTRRKYITRSLRTLNCYSVANIDFGNSNTYVDFKGLERIGTSREHYHAIVSVSSIDNFNKSFWFYGGLNFERIHYSDNTAVACAKYITKLTSHAVKQSTDLYNSSIIYIKPKKNKKSLQK